MLDQQLTHKEVPMRMRNGAKRSVAVPLQFESCNEIPHLSRLNAYNSKLKHRIGVPLDLGIGLDCIAEENMSIKIDARHIRKSKSFDFLKLTIKSASPVSH